MRLLLLSIGFLMTVFPAQAGVPECLSGHCLGERISNSSQWQPSSRNDRVGECNYSLRFLLKTPELFIGANVRRDTGQIYEITREIPLEPKKHSHRSVSDWDSLVRGKYGHPDKGPIVNKRFEDESKSQTYTSQVWWQYFEANNDGLGMQVVLHFRSTDLMYERFPGKLLQVVSIVNEETKDVVIDLGRECEKETVIPD